MSLPPPRVSSRTIDALSSQALLTLSKQIRIARPNLSPRRTSTLSFLQCYRYGGSQVLPSTIRLSNSSTHEYVEHLQNITYELLWRMYPSRQNSHKIVKRVKSNYESGEFPRIKSRDQLTVIRLADGGIVGYRVPHALWTTVCDMYLGWEYGRMNLEKGCTMHGG